MKARALPVLFVLGAVGCQTADTPGSDEGSSPRVTYYADVKPVIDARCNTCHGEDAIAPFTLRNFDEVSRMGPLLAVSVTERTMPPWPADSSCAPYQHDTSLSEEEIDVLEAWIDAEMPEGDPADEPEPLPKAAVELDRRDIHLAMTESHVPQPPEGELDEHYCFVLDWPSTETQYITGFETFPGNKKVLHHFVGVIISPSLAPFIQGADDQTPEYGFPCGAGMGMGGSSGGGPSSFTDDVRLFSGWVPGAPPVTYPEGTGIKVEPGSKILLNMHYNVVAGDYGADQTSFDFRVEPTVEKEGISMFVTDSWWLEGDNMRIPAGLESVIHGADVDVAALLGGPATIYHAGLHMHELGRSSRLAINRADGSQECLVDIPRWDFNWQINDQLANPTLLGNGETMHIECEWDNSEANQRSIGGTIGQPMDVAWGDDTHDEMCLGFIYATLQ